MSKFENNIDVASQLAHSAATLIKSAQDISSYSSGKAALELAEVMATKARRLLEGESVAELEMQFSVFSELLKALGVDVEGISGIKSLTITVSPSDKAKGNCVVEVTSNR